MAVVAEAIVTLSGCPTSSVALVRAPDDIAVDRLRLATFGTARDMDAVYHQCSFGLESAGIHLLSAPLALCSRDLITPIVLRASDLTKIKIKTRRMLALNDKVVLTFSLHGEFLNSREFEKNVMIAARYKSDSELVHMILQNAPCVDRLAFNELSRKCECGSDKLRLPTHSAWCPKYE